ncbi:hypothetical protein QE152_g4413 [Popillia japonica]|uniref:Uncharacterized protein n=1 Tax=Popillia japonica TaxID=7064 RepID=A0AAW1N0N2_POPJA
MSSTCKKCTCSIHKKSPGLFCAGDCRAFYHARVRSTGGQRSPIAYRANIDVEDSSFVVDDGSDVVDEGVSAMFKTIRRELASLNKKCDTFMESLNACISRVAEFEQSLNDKCKEIESIQSENKSLRADVNKLINTVEDLEQRGRLQNLEIQGVPHKQNENLFEVLSVIGQTIQCPIEKGDVDVVHRVAHMNKSSYPRNIIVRLMSRTKREEIIAAAKTARRLHPSQAGIFVPGFDRNIFDGEDSQTVASFAGRNFRSRI